MSFCVGVNSWQAGNRRMSKNTKQSRPKCRRKIGGAFWKLPCQDLDFGLRFEVLLVKLTRFVDETQLSPLWVASNSFHSGKVVGGVGK